MRRLTTLLAALGALLLVSAAPASASELTFKETFGSKAQPSFVKPTALAIDQSNGSLLVHEAEFNVVTGVLTVYRFNEDGTPFEFPAQGSNEIAVLTEESSEFVQMAVDSSGGPNDGDIYIVEAAEEKVSIYSEEGVPLGSLAFSGGIRGVAVDSSGNVYVSVVFGENAGIHKFEPSGSPVEKGDEVAKFTTVAIPFALAAGNGPTAGSLFANDSTGDIYKLNATTGAVEYKVAPGPTTTISVDPKTGYVYQATENKVIAWNASGGSPVEVTSTTLASEVEGIAINGLSGDVYAAREGNGNVAVYSAGAGPSGPTNLRTLTVTKNANGPGGTGSVSSKPKGIKCGATCSEAVARMYKSTPVELTAKPATGSAFVKWENAVSEGPCDGSTNPVCTVPMSEDTSLEAVFSGTSKTITPTEALTVSKGESTGKGTVKGPGLGCEADCTSTVVLFQGPITEPKAKPGKIVVLKQAPAFGSKFIGWSGCASEPEGNCQVAMESAKEVVAEYEALPNKVLTVNKEYAKGNGSVSSKPKGIACGTTCTQSVAQMPEGAKVELIAKPSTGTFVKWEGGDCNGSTSTTCVVTMNTDETTKAVFSDPGKAIAEAKTLTLNKAGSGFGTVKASGIKCEALCSSQSALYQGPLTEPKVKPGKVVILKATSAPGSKAVAWTGCDSNPSPSECSVEMDEAHAVTATFDELE